MNTTNLPILPTHPVYPTNEMMDNVSKHILNISNNKLLSNTSTSPCTIHTLSFFLLMGYSAVFIVGVGGNAIVMLIFASNWRKGPIIELLILYLAFFDFLSSIFGPLLFIYWIATCYRQWHLGWFACKLLPVLSRVFTNISIGVILMMAIDRCRAIVTPFKRRFTRVIIHSCVALTIFLSTLCESYYINALYIENGTCTVMEVGKPIYSYPLVILTTLRSIIFVTIFTFTTVAVYRKLKSTAIDRVSQRFRDKYSQRWRVMKMLVTMAIVFTITVIPRDIFHLAYTFSWMSGSGIPHSSTLVSMNSILRLLQASNSIYNVFIYGKMHDNFWNNIKVVVFRQSGKRYRTYKSIFSRSEFSSTYSNTDSFRKHKKSPSQDQHRNSLAIPLCRMQARDSLSVSDF